MIYLVTSKTPEGRYYFNEYRTLDEVRHFLKSMPKEWGYIITEDYGHYRVETEKRPVKQEQDNVNHPSHYTGKVECIDAIDTATAGLDGIQAVCTANVIKYLWRWKKKNGLEDLKKAKWYLELLMETEAKK